MAASERCNCCTHPVTHHAPQCVPTPGRPGWRTIDPRIPAVPTEEPNRA